MQLSPHFELSEFTRTQTGLPNDPPPHHLHNLQRLCDTLLEPLRLRVGRLYVSSGYRTPQVNAALAEAGYKVSKTSQHMRGQAADIKPLDMALGPAWGALLALRALLPIDQAIVYVRAPGKGWIHLSWAEDPRGDFRVDVPGKEKTIPWSQYRGEVVLPG